MMVLPRMRVIPGIILLLRGAFMLSLLNLYEHAGTIPGEVFTDVSLDKLISRNEITVLSKICNRADILARQQIFRLLEEQGFYDWLQRLYLNLKYLDKAKYMFEHAKNEVEQSALFTSYADIYIKSVESMENSINAALLSAVNDEAKARSSDVDMLKKHLFEYSELCKSISKIRVTLCADGTYFKKSADDMPSIDETIYLIAEKLGYRSELENQKLSYKMSYPMSAAIVKLYSEEFGKMAKLRQKMLTAIKPDILSLIGDIDFYLAINRLRKKAAERGVVACYPEISDAPAYHADNICDVSLILKDGAVIVPNDIDMSEGDSAFFVRGANGGGKTTYLRTVIINLIMFLGGCPVYGERARIYPFTSVFTHFPENEGFAYGGRLENEEKRLNEIMKTVGRESFLCFNETFSGADEQKGTSLSLDLMNEIRQKGAFALFVTHFHGVSDGDIPSLTTVVTGDENERTYKIVRTSGGRSSYAMDILKKHGLDRESLWQVKLC